MVLELAGDWLTEADIPPAEGIFDRMAGAGTLRLDADDLENWDSSLLVFLMRLETGCRKGGIKLDAAGLPPGVRRLRDLAQPERQQTEAAAGHHEPSWLEQLGQRTLKRSSWVVDALAFGGQVAVALARLVRFRSQVRPGDIGFQLQDCGAAALPIVSLISVLVGLILAFISAVQLQIFGAQLYVANLVGISMARDMGAMMTGVIMAGRTGAAFAASLGTMQVNEEIDALRTLGISPMEFLVLPRVLALVAMMPLLCCYADLMGIVGGGLVCVGLFDITPMQYFQQTRDAVPLHHFTGGLIKAAVYGMLIAVTGCHRGLACGRSAEAVGRATTDAVVTAIVWIVVWCAILTVVYNAIGL
jgi:phospholipid/cholesterol/gamma-HCH transport system permease protein